MLVLPGFDNTGSLGSPPHWVVYHPGSTLVTASHLLVGNREPELKPTTFFFSLHSYFSVFSSSSSDHPAIKYRSSSTPCWGYSIKYIFYFFPICSSFPKSTSATYFRVRGKATFTSSLHDSRTFINIPVTFVLSLMFLFLPLILQTLQL